MNRGDSIVHRLGLIGVVDQKVSDNMTIEKTSGTGGEASNIANRAATNSDISKGDRRAGSKGARTLKGDSSGGAVTLRVI